MSDAEVTVELDYEDGFLEGFLHGFMSAHFAPEVAEDEEAFDPGYVDHVPRGE